ncbi:hypothetical protein HNO52_00790 [Billgrantia diversa]|uniref:DUF6448 family protein n=1 Tax=Halomonas sp. MCCC 1A13316 TaxID=2733487 RepID=UPI0018A429FB|nr:DUF6448 family protein [Halomonas sp. MCCC 1A13316]QOR37199.1 hypothetical protein HNO52_00790 [Halomonas sp. MCCC 1A13316]
MTYLRLPLRKTLLALATSSVLTLALAAPAMAHCDALDGPVISEARTALESGDVTPILKWVPAEDEAQVKAIFDKVLEVRRKGGSARELADRQLFSELVEIHRASEGAPFTGIKPAGEIDPAIQAADSALEEGSIDAFLARIVEKFEHDARSAFEATLAAKRQADNSTEQGREFVKQYVQYVHYLEDVHNVITSINGHGH